MVEISARTAFFIILLTLTSFYFIFLLYCATRK
nr:MAG TPA: hypothetical protein [Bacteriophage sp.]